VTARSPWRLRSDLAWAHGLLWFARSGSGGREPLPEVHLFLAKSYSALAAYHVGRGSMDRARRLSEKAAWHYRRAGYDDPPAAAAMAMPVPRPEPVDAVSDRHAEPDGDGAA
jgi:hypothetical protein